MLYRFYRLNAAGRCVGFEDRACADDDDALRTAKTLTNAHDVAIWQGRRQIGNERPDTVNVTVKPLDVRSPRD